MAIETDRMRRRLGLRGRHALYGGALAALVVVVLTTLSYVTTRELAHRIAREQLGYAAAAIAAPVERALASVAREVEVLSRQTLLANALIDPEERDTNLRPYLIEHELPVELDYNLVLTDFRGAPLTARKAPQSYGGASWFAAVIDEGRPYAGIERRDDEAVLYVAMPILHRPIGAHEGALVLEASLTDWLGGTKPPFAWSADLAQVEFRSGDVPIAVATRVPAERLVTVARALDLGSSPIAAPLELRVSMDAEAFEAPFRDLLTRHLGWGLLAVVVVAALSYLLARAQTRRIEDLAEEARHIARVGHPARAMAAGRFGNDEVGDLAASLVKLLDELRSHQAGLESLVGRRTAELAAREADLNHAQSVAGIGSWTWNPDSGALEWTAECRRILGVVEGVDLGYERFLECVHPDDRDALRSAWAAALAGGGFDLEHRIVVAGAVRWVRERAELTFAADRRLIRALGTIQDLTARKEAEARMCEALVVFNASSQGIMTTDGQGWILAVNPAFCSITGYSADEVVGHRSSMFKSDRHDAAYFRALWETLSARGEWEGEIWNRRKNGEVYPQWMSISAVRDEQGRVLEYVSLFSDITRRKRQEEAVWRQANFDALTGLANRSLLHERLERAIAHARRAGGMAGLLFLDLDGFKAINDTLGHEVGDQMLVEVAARLKGCVRDEDTVARLGGDEFTIVVSDLHDVEVLRAIGEKMLQTLREPFELAGTVQRVSGSVGIAVYPEDGDDTRALLRNADIAMYKSKQAGKNRFQFYARQMQDDALARMRAEAELRVALAEQAFVLEYQPVVDAVTGELVAAEALIRWRHPERGIVAPGEFIPIAEDSGLVVAIGEWALCEAARQWQAWHVRDCAPPRLAVNVSGVQFCDAGLPALVARLLEEFGIECGGLVLEIRESVLTDAGQEVESRLRELKTRGVGYALDDFGTGFSSLSWLKRSPVDFVKIDRSFVRACHDDPNDAHLVAAIISMAHSLGLRVIAEGVETDAQAAFLREHVCDYLQGYLVSEPLPAPAFEALLRSRWYPAREAESA